MSVASIVAHMHDPVVELRLVHDPNRFVRVPPVLEYHYSESL